MARPSTAAAYLQRVWRGERRGLLAVGLRGTLRLPALVFSATVRARNAAFDRGWLPVHGVDAPVICVGNLTVGGTGKTPMVSRLVGHFRESGARVAVLCRGYGERAARPNDEALELRAAHPGLDVRLGADRVATARSAVSSGAEVLLLDDGFQHRGLARDLDVVLLDASQPACAYHPLPRGMLREPWSGIRRAGVVVLTRVDLADRDRIAWLSSRVERHAPDALVVEAVHRITRVTPLGADRDATPPGPVHLVCALGNPAAFEAGVRDRGLSVAGATVFADHHRYTRADVEATARAARDAGARSLVTTAKDAVKLESLDPRDPPVFVVHVEMALVREGDAFFERIDALR